MLRGSIAAIPLPVGVTLFSIFLTPVFDSVIQYFADRRAAPVDVDEPSRANYRSAAHWQGVARGGGETRGNGSREPPYQHGDA